SRPYADLRQRVGLGIARPRAAAHRLRRRPCCLRRAADQTPIANRRTGSTGRRPTARAEGRRHPGDSCQWPGRVQRRGSDRQSRWEGPERAPGELAAYIKGRATRRLSRMTLLGFIIFLVVGAVAGWIAGQIMRGSGYGLVGNIVVGVIGALIGGWLFGVLGIAAGGLIGSIIAAVIGAIILLALLRLIRRV